MRHATSKFEIHSAIKEPNINEDAGLEFGLFRVLRVEDEFVFASPIKGISENEEEIKLNTSLLLSKRRSINPGDLIDCLLCNSPQDGKIPRAVVDAALVLGFENREDPPGLVAAKDIPSNVKCIVIMRDFISPLEGFISPSEK
jgi:hypothetical protein